MKADKSQVTQSALLRYGVAHHRAGRLEAAERTYRGVLAAEPDNAEAWHLLGQLQLQAGAFDEAVACLSQAIELQPDAAATHHNLGTAHLEQGDAAAAVACFRHAVALDPALAATHANLGRALLALGEATQAVESFDTALAQTPGDANVIANRAVALGLCDDTEAAVAGLREAIALVPDDASYHHSLGTVLQRARRHGDAAKAFGDAFAREPDHPQALANLGSCLVRAGQVEAGVAKLEQALAANPDDDHAYFDLLANLPALCAWERLAALAGDLERRVQRLAEQPPRRRGMVLPLAFTLPYFSTDIALHKRVLCTVAEWLKAQVPRPAQPLPRKQCGGAKRLHIAYLSPDFGDHPIGHVTAPVYAAHDRERFEVSCYSLQDRSFSPGDYYRRIRDGADRFVDLSGETAGDAAARIRRDGADILVDLCGYMPNGRPEILAMRPAPLQVYWLGHGGGLGADYVDYVIGDPFITPAADDGHYAEAIARLPETFSSADRPAIAHRMPTREEQGLPRSGVVFCAFNNRLKMDRDSVSCWLEILHAVPGSVLWLNAGDLVAPTMRAAADAAGVDPSRLVVTKRVEDKASHFARHGLADIFLDTFVFNASTTALDALWAGLPVLTVPGPHFHSRIAAGYVSAVGMPQLICADRNDYRDRAIALARDPHRLAALKTELASKRLHTALFDNKRFVSHLEAAYENMWRRHRDGLAPASFDIAPLPEGVAA